MIEFLVLLVIVIITYLFWSLTYWSRKGLKGPTPLPIVGNMLDFVLAQKHYGEVYEDIYKQFPGAAYVPIYRLFDEPAILVRDLELIKNVFIKDFNSFHDNLLLTDKKMDELAHINPFIATGERWRELRSQMGQLFTPSKIKTVFPILKRICDRLENYVEANRENGTLEAKRTCAKFTIEVIASAGFGLEAEAFTNPNSYFNKCCENIFAPHAWSYFQNIGANFSLAVARIFRTPYIPEEFQHWLKSITKDVIESRKHETEKRNDFLELILNSKENSGQTISEETVFGHTATLLLEGFETASTTMAYSLYELARHPDLQKRVQTEMDAALEKHGGNLTYETICDMPYLDTVLQETLRLHPAMLATVKVCTEKFTLPPQYPGSSPVSIPVGTVIVIPVLAVHYDPDIYSNPHTFDPDRFSEDAQKVRSKCTFLAFGEGPRICIGMRFGLAQCKAGLTTLLHKYNVRLSPKTKIPPKISPHTFLNNARGGTWINFDLRNTT